MDKTEIVDGMICVDEDVECDGDEVLCVAVREGDLDANPGFWPVMCEDCEICDPSMTTVRIYKLDLSRKRDDYRCLSRRSVTLMDSQGNLGPGTVFKIRKN